MSIPLASGGIAGADSGAPVRFEFPEHGTTPFHQRLVDRVQSGQFVEMRDLLTDNMSLLQQINVLGGQ